MAKVNFNLYLRAWIGTTRYHRKVLDQAAHSILGNFLAILACHMYQSGVNCQVKNTSGTTESPTSQTWSFNSRGALADATQGILVGRGAGAVTLADYNFNIPITHGNTANKLWHNLQTFAPVAKSASVWEYALTRTFTNLSGAQVDVTESGIVMQYGTPASGGGYALCIRDFFAALPVPNNKTLTIQYTIAIPLL